MFFSSVVSGWRHLTCGSDGGNMEVQKSIRVWNSLFVTVPFLCSAAVWRLPLQLKDNSVSAPNRLFPHPLDRKQVSFSFKAVLYIGLTMLGSVKRGGGLCRNWAGLLWKNSLAQIFRFSTVSALGDWALSSFCRCFWDIFYGIWLLALSSIF